MEPTLSGAHPRIGLREEVRETLALSRNCAQTSFSVLEREFALEGGAGTLFEPSAAARRNQGRLLDLLIEHYDELGRLLYSLHGSD